MNAPALAGAAVVTVPVAWGLARHWRPIWQVWEDIWKWLVALLIPHRRRKPRLSLAENARLDRELVDTPVSEWVRQGEERALREWFEVDGCTDLGPSPLPRGPAFGFELENPMVATLKKAADASRVSTMTMQKLAAAAHGRNGGYCPCCGVRSHLSLCTRCRDRMAELAWRSIAPDGQQRQNVYLLPVYPLDGGQG